jgi:hypothetical protein
VRPEEHVAGHPTALAVHGLVQRLLEDGSVEVRTSRSQVAFRRRRGFAHLRLPGRHLRDRAADVVLSVVLAAVTTPRAGGRWCTPRRRAGCTTPEGRDPAEIDDEAAAWLREAADRAG